MSSRQAAQSHATLIIPDCALSVNCAVSNTNAFCYLFLLLRNYEPPATPFRIASTLKAAPRTEGISAQKSVIDSTRAELTGVPDYEIKHSMHIDKALVWRDGS